MQPNQPLVSNLCDCDLYYVAFLRDTSAFVFALISLFSLYFSLFPFFFLFFLFFFLCFPFFFFFFSSLFVSFLVRVPSPPEQGPYKDLRVFFLSFFLPHHKHKQTNIPKQNKRIPFNTHYPQNIPNTKCNSLSPSLLLSPL